jgi:hypothetical protein
MNKEFWLASSQQREDIDMHREIRVSLFLANVSVPKKADD